MTVKDDPESMRQFWLGKLEAGPKAILQFLLSFNGEEVDKQDITTTTGYVQSTRDRYIRGMISRKIVEKTGAGKYRAVKLFFE